MTLCPGYPAMMLPWEIDELRSENARLRKELDEARAAMPHDSQQRALDTLAMYEKEVARLNVALAQVQAAQAAAVAAEREACARVASKMFLTARLNDPERAVAWNIGAGIRARAALSGAGAGDGWLPLASAPQDGQVFLIAGLAGTGPTLGHFADGYFRLIPSREKVAGFGVWFWRPLPAPPADAPDTKCDCGRSLEHRTEWGCEQCSWPRGKPADAPDTEREVGG